MPAAVVPAIQGGAALASYFGGRAAAGGAATPGPQEQAALNAQTRAGTALGGQGAALGGMGLAAQQQGLGYFSSLASGNRGAMQQALSPQIQQLNQTYGGTRRTLARFLRGPERDYQLGELERERSGGVASLFANARPNAVGQLLNYGGQMTGQGISALGGAGGIFGGQAAQLAYNRLSGAELQRQAGMDVGGLVFQLLKGLKPGGGGDANQ
jgi:hypothetical protein